MNKIKSILIVLIAGGLVVLTGYMSMKTIDEKLQSRLPDTEIAETEETEAPESAFEAVFEPIETEEVQTNDIETETAETSAETSDTTLSESSPEIQPIVEEVPDVYVETDGEPVIEYTELSYDPSIAALAQTLFGECGSGTKTEQAAVIWCVLNRVDDPTFPNTIIEVVTARYQFQGYSPYNPVEADHYAICEDVVNRWYMEKAGATDVGRVLPKEYCYFEGDGYYNHYTTEWKGTDYWTWTLQSPYMD